MKRKRDILIGALKKGADMAVVGGDKLVVAAAPHAESLVNKGREAIKPSPISPDNWYRKAADACEEISDIFLPNESRIKGRAQNLLSAKLGGAGAAAGIFSLAGMVGTASTGTAIGGLSGAAATSATLAWLGGSVFVGGLVMGGATIVGGLGAVKAMQFAKSRLYAKKMALHELGPDEAMIVNACVPLAIAFRQRDISGQNLDSCSARAIRDDVMVPLQTMLNEYKFDHQDLPYLTQRKLNENAARIVDLYYYLRHWVKRNPGIGTGIVSAVFVQLLAEIVPDFTTDEIVVLDALRRSSNALNDATIDELSAYVKGLAPAQLVGLQNNVKGIYHEICFASRETKDNFVVELFTETNHPGADVRIIDQVSGEVKEVQLKATNFLSYVEEHNERYPDIEVLATSEVCALSPDLMSSGFSNEDLSRDVQGVTDKLQQNDDMLLTEGMITAGMVTLGRNCRVLMKGKNMSATERSDLVKEGIVSAGTTGLLRLLLG